MTFIVDIYVYHKIKPVQSLYKNKYYSYDQMDNMGRKYLWNYYKTETKNVKNFIIDQVDKGSQLGAKKYLKIKN